jgi:hypothetical protein
MAANILGNGESSAVKRIVDTEQHHAFLSPCSPDLDPIEMALGKQSPSARMIREDHYCPLRQEIGPIRDICDPAERR